MNMLLYLRLHYCNFLLLKFQSLMKNFKTKNKNKNVAISWYGEITL